MAGNVRELENSIERGVVLSSGTIIGPTFFPATSPPQLSGCAARAQPQPSLFDILEDIERRIIIEKLERCNWNQTDAAEQFHIPLSTLNQKSSASTSRFASAAESNAEKQVSRNPIHLVADESTS